MSSTHERFFNCKFLEKHVDTDNGLYELKSELDKISRVRAKGDFKGTQKVVITEIEDTDHYFRDFENIEYTTYDVELKIFQKRNIRVPGTNGNMFNFYLQIISENIRIEYTKESVIREGDDLVVLYKNLFSEREREVAIKSILRNYGDKFQQDHPVMMGVVTNPKRKTCQVSETGVTYNYNGSQGVTNRFTPILYQIKKRVELVTKVKYNFALLNLYEDGESSIGEHSDNERGLVENGKIASLSLGDTRNFYFRSKTDKDRKIVLELEGGDLLVMCGSTQKNWKHAVPKRKNKRLRVNITFRQVLVSNRG